MHDKTGLGFNTSKIRQSYENTFISEKEKIKCLFCHKEGHLESYCFHKKRYLILNQNILVLGDQKVIINQNILVLEDQKVLLETKNVLLK